MAANMLSVPKMLNRNSYQRVRCTLYVGLQHAVPPTSTSPDSSGYTLHKHSQAQNIIFQIYTHISGYAGSPILPTDKKCDFYNNKFQYFLFSQFRRDFSAIRVQEFIKLIPIKSYFPEVRAFGTLITSAEVFCKII